MKENVTFYRFMINEHHQEQAALYALGALDLSESSALEQEIALHPDLCQEVDSFQAVVAKMSVAFSPVRKPSRDLKSRVLKGLEGLGEPEASSFNSILKEREGIVVTDKDGLVEWINDTMSEMCGHVLAEVRGKKLGPLLQGPLTDPQAVQNMRDAIQHRRYVTLEILNYHKNGTPYWVSLTISPVMDSDNQVRSFIAIEREIKGRPVPVS